MKAQNEKRKLEEKPHVTGCIWFNIKSEDEKVSVYTKMIRIELCMAGELSSVKIEQVHNTLFDAHFN